MKDFKRFVRSHNLINRIYDMLIFFEVIKDSKHEEQIKRFFMQRIEDITYVETLAKYFEEKLRKNGNQFNLK